MSDTNYSTKERPGEYDAIETAKPGEPLFPIQGGDPIGPLVVMFWAWKARQLARRMDEDSKERSYLLRKATSAESVAWSMREYQKGENDVAGVRASYTDDGPPLVIEHGDRVKIRQALIAGVGHLNNAIGIAQEVAEMLDAAGLSEFARDEILAGIDCLKTAAKTIEPRRGNERT